MNCEDCSLRRRDCFRSLSPDELQFVHGLRRGQGELAAGRFLFKQGDAPKALYTLHEGWAASCAEVPGEPLRMTEILLPGDLVGAPACIAGKHNRSVVALTRLRYCILDRSLIEKLSQRGGPLCFALLQDFVTHRIRREKMTMLLRKGSPLQRLAYFFLDTFTRLKAIGVGSETMCPFPLRRGQLAEIVGLSQVHVSRTMAEMRNDGLIEIANSVLYISNEERLAGIAGPKPAVGSERRLLI